MADCVCRTFPEGERRMWCERHQCWKTAHWHFLCKTRDDYRSLWDNGKGPGQYVPELSDKKKSKLKTALEYLTCKHRGNVVATIAGNMVGCGCGGTRVEFYECQHFYGEAVLLDCKQWAKKANQEKIQAACPTYNGRTCRECELWTQSLSQSRGAG